MGALGRRAVHVTGQDDRVSGRIQRNGPVADQFGGLGPDGDRLLLGDGRPGAGHFQMGVEMIELPSRLPVLQTHPNTDPYPARIRRDPSGIGCTPYVRSRGKIERSFIQKDILVGLPGHAGSFRAGIERVSGKLRLQIVLLRGRALLETDDVETIVLYQLDDAGFPEIPAAFIRILVRDETDVESTHSEDRFGDNGAVVLAQVQFADLAGSLVGDIENGSIAVQEKASQLTERCRRARSVLDGADIRSLRAAGDGGDHRVLIPG